LANTLLSVNDATSDDALLEIKSQIESAKSSNDQMGTAIWNEVWGKSEDKDNQQVASQAPEQTYPFGMGQQAASQVSFDPTQATAMQPVSGTVPQFNTPPVPPTGGQVAGPLPQQPFTNQPAGMSPGMSALNEVLEKEATPYGNPIEPDQEEIS
jgi:hypothetical protein